MAERLSKNVAVKTLRGRVTKGRVERFDPASGEVRVMRGDGEMSVFPLSDLKAIFFLREGKRPPIPEAAVRPGAVKVRIDFADGERLVGYTYGRRAEERGFFVYPVGKTDANERVYVVRDNAVKISFGV